MENTNIANTEEQVNKTQEQETQETQETKKDIANEEQVNNTHEVEPYKVFKTEEEFNKHAQDIRLKTNSKVLKELGVESKEQLEQLKNEISNALTEKEQLDKANATISEEVNELKLDNTLLSNGIAKDNLKYIKLDLVENDIDISDNDKLNEFLKNSKWTKQQSNINLNANSMQQTSVDNNRSTATASSLLKNFIK